MLQNMNSDTFRRNVRTNSTHSIGLALPPQIEPQVRALIILLLVDPGCQANLLLRKDTNLHRLILTHPQIQNLPLHCPLLQSLPRPQSHPSYKMSQRLAPRSLLPRPTPDGELLAMQWRSQPRKIHIALLAHQNNLPTSVLTKKLIVSLILDLMSKK